MIFIVSFNLSITSPFAKQFAKTSHQDFYLHSNYHQYLLVTNIISLSLSLVLPWNLVGYLTNSFPPTIIRSHITFYFHITIGPDHLPKKASTRHFNTSNPDTINDQQSTISTHTNHPDPHLRESSRMRARLPDVVSCEPRMAKIPHIFAPFNTKHSLRSLKLEPQRNSTPITSQFPSLSLALVSPFSLSCLSFALSVCLSVSLYSTKPTRFCTKWDQIWGANRRSVGVAGGNRCKSRSLKGSDEDRSRRRRDGRG